MKHLPLAIIFVCLSNCHPIDGQIIKAGDYTIYNYKIKVEVCGAINHYTYYILCDSICIVPPYGKSYRMKIYDRNGKHYWTTEEESYPPNGVLIVFYRQYGWGWDENGLPVRKENE